MGEQQNESPQTDKSYAARRKPSTGNEKNRNGKKFSSDRKQKDEGEGEENEKKGNIYKNDKSTVTASNFGGDIMKGHFRTRVYLCPP